MARTALICGISGQVGSYLGEYLLSLNYHVHGLVRHTSDLASSRWRIESFAAHPSLSLHYGDLLDSGRLARLLREIQPDEIYNLAAQSHVKVSFDLPEQTGDVNAMGVCRLLEAYREHCPGARFYQASTSELFGDSAPPQCESTPMRPRSPYGCAKLYSYWMVKNYREAYGLHTSNGILFNTESPRRSPAFVTRKITRGIARVKLGLERAVVLGNSTARRDWMHVKDAVRGIHAMLQRDKGGDFVLASGRSESVAWFAQAAAAAAGAPAVLCEHRNEERLADIRDEGFTPFVEDSAYLRPLEVDHLCGDSSKAREVLGWKAEIGLEELVKEMVESDLRLEREAAERDATRKLLYGDPDAPKPQGVIYGRDGARDQ